MKKLYLFLTFSLLLIVTYSQAPSNDCGENYLAINQCGISFSVTQAQMGNATDDEFCDVGGSCPVTYVNGEGYENFDCVGSDDDFSGSIENSLWWGFVPDESCDYDITIDITNCCCKDKGSSNSAQYQIFDADAPLPGGTIQSSMAYQTGVTGSFSETISVTQGNTVYILLDGLNGTDCDIDVSIQPTASCSGCILVMAENIWDFNVDYKNQSSVITWGSEDLEGVKVEHSTNGTDWSMLTGFISNTAENTYLLKHPLKYIGYNYYRISIDDYKTTRTKVVYHTQKTKSIIKHVDATGKEISDLDSYRGLIIVIYEDGSSDKILK